MLCVAALAFDFDGTLVDIAEPYSMAFNETLKKFGLPPFDPIELYRAGASDLKAQFLRVFSRVGADVSLVQECVKTHCEIYMRIHLKHLKEYDNALSTVRKLHLMGFKLALITGRPRVQVEPELEFLQIRDCFNPVLTSDAVARPKPAPDMVTRTADILNISPSRILVVGDSPDDISAAKGAGALSAGICGGYFSREMLVGAEPDFLLRSVSDVLRIVSGCRGTA